MGRVPGVELTYEQADQICLTTLLNMQDELEVARRNRIAGGMAIFDSDKEMDIAFLNRHISSVALIVEYMTVPDKWVNK